MFSTKTAMRRDHLRPNVRGETPNELKSVTLHTNGEDIWAQER